MKISKSVEQDWSSVLQDAVPQGVAAEYGRIQILYKQGGLEEDYELVVAGYASPQIIDREKHLITKEAMQNDLPRFLAHPHYRNAMIVHSNIQVGEVLPRWTNPKTNEEFETKVDDIGLFVVVKLRTDKYRPEICEKVEKDIQAGKLSAFSISGDAPFDSRRHVCHNGTCFWIIDKIIFYEITICEQGVNQDAKFAILSKMAHCTDGVCELPLPSYVTTGAIQNALDKHMEPGMKPHQHGPATHQPFSEPAEGETLQPEPERWPKRGARPRDVFGLPKRGYGREIGKAGGGGAITPETPMQDTEAGKDPTKPDIGEKAGGAATGHGSIPTGSTEQKGEVTVAEDFAQRMWQGMGRPYSFDQFKVGLGVEWEHADILGGDWMKVAAVVLDHLKEDEQYYTKLAQVEKGHGVLGRAVVKTVARKSGFAGGGNTADVGSGWAEEVHDVDTAGKPGGMQTDRTFDEAEEEKREPYEAPGLVGSPTSGPLETKCKHGIVKGGQTWGPPDFEWAGQEDDEKAEKHATNDTHKHGSDGVLPTIPQIKRPKPVKQAGVTYKAAIDPSKTTQFSPQYARDDAAGGEESEEYYLNKGELSPDLMTGRESDRFYQRCPLCATQSIIERALDNRTLYSRMSGEFRGVLRHCLMVLQQGTGGLDYIPGKGWLALADDHAYTGYMRSGYGVPLALAVATIGVSAFDIGDAALVRAATETANRLLDQHPLSKGEYEQLLARVTGWMGKNLGLVIARAKTLSKGYSVGWLGDAQRTLQSVQGSLANVDRKALSDDLNVALGSISDDVEHLVAALGLTEQMKGQVKGVEPAALDVVREVAKDTEHDVDAANEALEAIDPERIEQRGDSEKNELDNPDQTIHPDEVAVMTGAPPGVPTGNANASVIHRGMDTMVERLLGWLPPENTLRQLYSRIFGQEEPIEGPDDIETLIIEWGRANPMPDVGTEQITEDTVPLAKAMMPPGLGTTSKTDENFDLWGAPNRSEQNRGPGRRQMGPTTEEFDTLDQGQHPAYDFSRPTQPEGLTKDAGAPTAGMPEADVAVNRGVATDEEPEDPLAVAAFGMEPDEPRQPDPDSTAGHVEEKDTGARNDRFVPDPSRVSNLNKDPATDEPVHVKGAGAGRRDQFSDQGPPGVVNHRQPIQEREYDNRGALVPQLNMGVEDAKALFKLHASLWSRYVSDKHFGLAVVELDDDGEPVQIVDVARRQKRRDK